MKYSKSCDGKDNRILVFKVFCANSVIEVLTVFERGKEDFFLFNLLNFSSVCWGRKGSAEDRLKKKIVSI